MKFLVGIFFISIITRFSFGLSRTGFKVTQAWSGALRDEENYFSMPRTMEEAKNMGYIVVPRDPDHGLDVTMVCLGGDVRVCPLMDRNGTVAGLQIAIPVEELRNSPQDLSTKMIQRKFNGTDYWTASSYFESPETIKNGGRRGPIKETVESLWIPDGDELANIPLKASDLPKANYSKQNCIPNMGTHYYKNISIVTDCRNFLQFAILVKEGEVIGMAWQTFGRIKEYGRNWFEIYPAETVEYTVPEAPPCLHQWVEEYGLISMHIYFVEQPWNIKCEANDNLKPMSTADKVTLNGLRYITRIVDGAKKILG